MEYAMKNLSSLGYPDYCITESGRIYSLKSKRFLSTQYNDGGYAVVTLRKDGKTNTLKIHRLLCLMFKPETHFDGAFVNHKDGNKKNNNLDNLEWCSRSENVLHAYELGLIKNKPRQITEDTVHDICARLEDGARIADVAREFEIDRTIIYSIYDGSSYKHISYEYNFSKVPKNMKYSTDKIIAVCDLIQLGAQLLDISVETGVHLSTVKMIKQRRIHSHISNSFNW